MLKLCDYDIKLRSQDHGITYFFIDKKKYKFDINIILYNNNNNSLFNNSNQLA